MPDNPAPSSELVLYQTEDGQTRIQCRFENETIWLTQALIGELFQVSVPTVNEHLKGIYADAELQPGATIRKFRILRTEGGRQVSREQLRLVAQALAGPALKGGELGDVSPTAEVSALGKLTANRQSVVEDGALTTGQREEKKVGQKQLI